jgi:hypothetical protein
MAVYGAVAVLAASIVQLPLPARAHDWAVCRYLSNGHICGRPSGTFNSDMMYHKTGGSQIQLRFYVRWPNGSVTFDNGYFYQSAGQVRTFVFSGIPFSYGEFDYCIRVVNQGDFCL